MLIQSGLINKVALRPANVTDARGLKHVCPSQGAVYVDKGYVRREAVEKSCLPLRGDHPYHRMILGC